MSDPVSNSSLDTACTPSFRRVLGAQVLAPGHDPHPERPADGGHLGTHPTQPDHPEGVTRQVSADRALPAAVAYPLGLGGDPAYQGQDESPGEFGGAGGDPAGAGDDDPAPRRRRQVDGDVGHPGRDQQPQSGQPVEYGCGERGPLPHRHHDLGVREPPDENLDVVDVVGEDGHLDPVPEPVPATELPRHILVVVEHRDPNSHLRLPYRRGPSAGP